MKDRASESESEVMTVAEKAKQITPEATGNRAWIDREIWTERMLAALGNGVKGNKLRALLRKQDKRPGIGRCYADHRRWPNAFFAEEGLFTMTEARLLASQSR